MTSEESRKRFETIRQIFDGLLKSRSRDFRVLGSLPGRSFKVRFLSFSVQCAKGKGEEDGAIISLDNG